MNTYDTAERIRQFTVVVRIANQLNKVHRGCFKGKVSLLKIATEEFDLTPAQYQKALYDYRREVRLLARQRITPLAA